MEDREKVLEKKMTVSLLKRLLFSQLEEMNATRC